MAPTINIVYENKTNLFFPGQVVRGYVEVTTDKEREVKVLKIKVVGRAKVEWDKYDHTQHRNINYSKSEEYYSQKYNLWGNGSDIQIMPVGTHRYNFESTLPKEIPASFESKHGYVRHACTATMDVKGIMFDVTETVPFSVGSDVDLNQIPEAKEPIVLKEEKKVTRIFSKSGHISFVLNIDHKGFVPGENIIINAECTNNSDKPTDATKLKLVQEVTCRASSQKKKETTVVCSLDHKETNPGASDIWSGEILKVPPLPPTGLPGCKIIDIAHYILFEFVPGGLSFTLEGKADLIIGAIPLSQGFGKFTTSSCPVASGWSGLYPDLPPPYSECGFSAEDGGLPDDAGDKKPFSPTYVTYNSR